MQNNKYTIENPRKENKKISIKNLIYSQEPN